MRLPSPLHALLLGAFVLCLADPAHAVWPPDGVAVGGPQAKGNNASAIPDGAGGWYVVWEDRRINASAADIRLQRLAPTGDLAPGWPVDGLVVSGLPTSESSPAISGDGSGGALLVWSDARNVSAGWGSDIYAQRILASGLVAPGWTPGGVLACHAPVNQFSPSVTGDGLGGAYVVWKDWRSFDVDHIDRVVAQHITATGQIAAGWPADGLEVSDKSTGGPRRLIPDAEGGCFVVWDDSRRAGGVPPDGLDIYAQRLRPDGSTAPGWLPNGNLVRLKQNLAQVLPDGAGGFYVTSVRWIDEVIFGDSEYWLSRFGPDGAPAAGWTITGVPLVTLPNFREFLAASADSMGGVIAAWDESRGLGGDIYAVRILPSGAVAPGWVADGLVVSDVASVQEYVASVAPDGSGGAYFAWERQLSTARGYVQHIGSHGTIAAGWPVGGLAVANSLQQFHTQIAHDGFAGAIAYWEEAGPSDLRRGIFAQNFLTDGIVATQLALVSSHAISDRVTLVWQGAGAGALQAWIERREGAEGWQRRGDAAHESPDRLKWEDGDVVPGARYGYRLGYVEDGVTRHSGETWIEVPSGLVLSLDGFRPNPAVDELRVSFALASDDPASLDLLDLAGRRIAGREVGSMGAGRHLVRLDPADRPAPGVYWLRLRQGERQLLQRAVVVR